MNLLDLSFTVILVNNTLKYYSYLQVPINLNKKNVETNNHKRFS